MKKILFINTVYNGGGAAHEARKIYSFLSLNAFDGYFAYGRGKKIFDKKVFKFGNMVENAIHFLIVRFLGIEGWGTYFSTKKLINYIKKEKFDLVHLHNLHGYYVNFFMLVEFLKKENIPTIWSLQDEWILTWMLAHSMGCSHCKTGKGKCTSSYFYPKTYNKLFAKFMLSKKRKAFENWDNLTIVSPANWLANEVKNSYLSDKDIRVIHNSADTDLFRPSLDKITLREIYNLPKDKKIIAFSATHFRDKNKGVIHILKVADILKNENYLFLGMGNGILPKRENIKTFGYVSNIKTMTELLAVSDIFCFTSDVETQSLAVLEALSSGLPVLAFDILALREVIDKNVGSLVLFGDHNKLAEEVNIILKNKKLLMEKSENARNLVVNKFSKDQICNNYLKLYQEILK